MSDALKRIGNLGPQDWSEDRNHENGSYINRCVNCTQGFIGHKRRLTCKLCDKITDLERENAKLREERDELKRESETYAEAVFERWSNSVAQMVNEVTGTKHDFDSTPGEAEDETRGYIIGQFRDALESSLAAANERAEGAEQELVNISRTSQGVLLTEAQDGWHKSQMKYLEMTERCRVAEAQSDALRKALDDATGPTSPWDCHEHRSELQVSKMLTVYHAERGQLCVGEKHWDGTLWHPIQFKDALAAWNWIKTGHIAELQEGLCNIAVRFSRFSFTAAKSALGQPT